VVKLTIHETTGEIGGIPGNENGKFGFCPITNGYYSNSKNN
jgi:hypothetical protein